jgi:hypothetical protein
MLQELLLPFPLHISDFSSINSAIKTVQLRASANVGPDKNEIDIYVIYLLQILFQLSNKKSAS